LECGDLFGHYEEAMPRPVLQALPILKHRVSIMITTSAPYRRRSSQ
jgi:hypothetical protein